MRKFKIIGILVLTVLFLGGCTLMRTEVKEDLTPGDLTRITINGVIDQSEDLLNQCRAYAKVDPDFKLMFQRELLSIFDQVSEAIDTANKLLGEGDLTKIDLRDARNLLRDIALKLATAKRDK